MQTSRINNYANMNFKALPGGKIKSILINQPEKMQEITNFLAPFGDQNTVIDIFTGTRKYSKEKIYSLRLYNKVFGSQHNVPLTKNKNIEYMPQKLLPRLEMLTNRDILWGEDNLFRIIKNEYKSSLPIFQEYLNNIISGNNEKGISLGASTQKRFKNIWNS